MSKGQPPRCASLVAPLCPDSESSLSWANSMSDRAPSQHFHQTIHNNPKFSFLSSYHQVRPNHWSLEYLPQYQHASLMLNFIWHIVINGPLNNMMKLFWALEKMTITFNCSQAYTYICFYILYSETLSIPFKKERLVLGKSSFFHL